MYANNLGIKVRQEEIWRIDSDQSQWNQQTKK